MKAKNSQTLNSEIELQIDSLSFHGGRGVGRFEGVVVFVPDTAPGDLVRARVVRKKSRLWEAELLEILKSAPARRQAPCPVADRCGGCVWQHIEYSEQIAQKEQILQQSLRGLRKFGDWETLPFLKAPDEFHYRSRIQLQVQGTKFGFFAKQSHRLVETDTCLIAAKPIDDALKTLHVANTERVELSLDEAGRLHILEGRRGSDARVFSQVNQKQNWVLREILCDWVEGAPAWIFDLYSGSGNLTLPLAQKFKGTKILAAELSASAVELGRTKAPQIEWHSGDMAKTLSRIKKPAGEGVIVLDPPRTGCTPEVPPAIAKFGAKQIVYVSCNPTTFARDVGPWLESGNYRLSRVQGLDMFPQTEHVELIASLCAAT